MSEARRARPLLGTLVEIHAVACLVPAQLSSAIDAAFAAIAEVHRLMSVHEAGSEASLLNREAYRRIVRVSTPTWAVLEAALRFSEDSDGAFDLVVGGRLQALGLLPPNAGETDPAASWRDIELLGSDAVCFLRPLSLDFGGIAKGYAVDCATAVLREAGVERALVNAGGDLRVFGATPQTIQIRDPRDPARCAHRLALNDRALATSGAYFSRAGNGDDAISALIEPRGGQSYIGGDSVSVVASDCMTADALTKAVLFARPECIERLLEKYDAQALYCAAIATKARPEPSSHKPEPVMPSKIIHRGGCHCGAVRFEVHAPARLVVQSCNCSMCARSAFLHLIVPATDFHLLQGADQLTTYSFNTHTAKHLFCKVCGVKSYYVPRSNPDGFSVNFRCLDAGTIDSFEVEPFDGQNWEQHGAALAHLSR